MHNKEVSKPVVNYYSVLNVSPKATETEIKKAFRRMAMRYHPDFGGGATTDRFILAKEAHDTLTNEEKKSAYDRKLLRKSNGDAKAMADAKHNLAFVTEHLKRKRTDRLHGNFSPQLKVTITANQCMSCHGFGSRRDQFGMLKACRLCGGAGRRKRARF